MARGPRVGKSESRESTSFSRKDYIHSTLRLGETGSTQTDFSCQTSPMSASCLGGA